MVITMVQHQTLKCIMRLCATLKEHEKCATNTAMHQNHIAESDSETKIIERVKRWLNIQEHLSLMRSAHAKT